MFRATMCPSSGEPTVSMRHWQFSLCTGGCLVCWLGWDSSQPTDQTATRTEWKAPSAIVARIRQVLLIMGIFFPLGRCDPTRPMVSWFLRFLNHTQRRITVGRTTLDEWSVRCRELYLTTHDTHPQQTNIHASGAIRTHDLSRRAAADLRLRPRGYWWWAHTRSCLKHVENSR